jgi:hypothetical protein
MLFPRFLSSRVVKKLETSKGSFILISSLREAQTWLASLLSLTVLEVCRLPFIDNLVVDLMTGKPPQILHNLHLVAWRILGGSTPSRTSLSTLGSSRKCGAMVPAALGTFRVAKHILALEAGNRFFSEKHF